MRFLHTTDPSSDASIAYFEIVEAVSLQAAEVYGACESYENSDVLPTMVRLHVAALCDLAATLNETSICWSTPADRSRLASELHTARTDLLAGFDLINERGEAQLPGYMNRVVAAVCRLFGVLRIIESVLMVVDREFPASVAGREFVEFVRVAA